MRSIAMTALVFASAAPLVTVYAAGVSKALVTIQYTDTVVPAEMQAYEAGIKAYVQCLREHRVTFNEYAFSQLTGRDTYRISFEREPMTWAERDKLGSESSPCKTIFNMQVNPHLKSESAEVLVEEPGMSHMPAGWRNQPTPGLLVVEDFTLKPDRAAAEAFVSALTKITEAADQTRSPIYYRTLEVQAGGDGAPDYALIHVAGNWSGYGKLLASSPWQMVETVYGKAAANAIRKSFDDSVAKTSVHIARYDAALSYIAGINSSGPVSRISGTGVGQWTHP